VKSAYYRRLYDKVVYMLGILLLWNFAFYLGRYPEDFIFNYFAYISFPLVAIRWIHYFKMKMHYYLTDLCYYSTILLIYHVHFEPTSEAMLRMTFLFSNGCLAVSIMAFRN